MATGSSVSSVAAALVFVLLASALVADAIPAPVQMASVQMTSPLQSIIFGPPRQANKKQCEWGMTWVHGRCRRIYH